jgi:hypothetical protein
MLSSSVKEGKEASICPHLARCWLDAIFGPEDKEGEDGANKDVGT